MWDYDLLAMVLILLAALVLLRFVPFSVLPPRRRSLAPKGPKGRTGGGGGGHGLLVLDLNHVLIHRLYALTLERVRADAKKVGSFYVWRRPHLEEFLKWAFGHYDEVAVWTSANYKNAHLLCEFVFGILYRDRLKFIWNPIRTLGKDEVYVKPLESVWRAYPEYGPHNTLIMDDTLEKVKENPPECVALAKSWTHEDDEDDYLLRFANKNKK